MLVAGGQTPVGLHTGLHVFNESLYLKRTECRRICFCTEYLSQRAQPVGHCQNRSDALVCRGVEPRLLCRGP